MKIFAGTKRFIPLLLLITSGTLIYAFAPTPRTDLICGYMSTEAKIYCYGGQQKGAGGILTASFQHYFFSLNLAQDWEVGKMLTGWELINQDLGPNVNFAMVMVPDENLIFMHGGGMSSVVQTRYKAAYFNTTDRVGWKQVIPEQTGSRVVNHAAVLGPDNSTIYIWGGMRSVFTGPMEPGDEKFPLSMYTLDVKNWRWGTGSVAPQPLTFTQSVIVGSTIYYIGGYRIVEGLVRANTMDSVLMYNTDSGGWQRQSIGGTVTPSTRMGHTVTLKPSTGEIIVFGGVNPGDQDATREDYFYLLSTQGDNLTWSTRELGGFFDAVGIVGHSSVLAEDYLLVMFGAINWDNKTSIYVYSNDVRVLDVNTWTWLTSISALTPVVRPSTAYPEENGDDNIESSVSIGTIVGAVVGGVAGLAIIIGIIVFLLLRRRRKWKLEKEENKISSARMLPGEIEHGTVKDSLQSSTVEDQPSAFISSEKPALFKKNPVKPDGG